MDGDGGGEGVGAGFAGEDCDLGGHRGWQVPGYR